MFVGDRVVAISFNVVVWMNKANSYNPVIARNNCLQVSKLPKLEITDLWKYDEKYEVFYVDSIKNKRKIIEGREVTTINCEIVLNY